MKYRSRKRNIKKAAAPIATAVFVIVAAIFIWDGWIRGNRQDLSAECEFHFIDVGQGDSTLIVTEDAAVLIDAGPTDAAETTARYIRGYTDTIDYMILTHPHEDHIGGAVKIINSLEVKNVIMTDASNDVVTFSRLIGVIEDSGVRVIEAQVGNTYDVGGIGLQILAPLADLDDFNEYSVVTRVEYENVSAIVTGDAESGSEELMLETYTSGELDADILKLGHHGSNTSSTSEFLAAVSPRWAIASCGQDNSYGHPHQQTLERARELGIPVLRTDEMGTIIFATDGEDLWLEED
ncbi:MAG: MBL fold metallo-hydrolase [Clostridiales bacterium]|nr:MBL fold metallo-hydrolase [Clostridiales bacterium]